MVDVNALKILARMAKNEDRTNARFQFKNKEGKVICSATTLEEIYNCVSKLDGETIYYHLHPDKAPINLGEMKDLAFYIHYVFGDVELSMKLYTIADKYKDDLNKLKIEVINVLFTRLLNFSEISLIPD